MEGKITHEAAAIDASASGGGESATDNTHLFVSDPRSNEVVKQSSGVNLELAESESDEHHSSGSTQHSKGETSGPSSNEPEPGNQTDDFESNRMEEDFLKMMLKYSSGDINMTIELQSQLVSLIPDHRSDKPSELNTLSNSYQVRFGRFGDPSDIEKAIECLNKAIAILPPGHLGHPVCLNNLGSTYRSRYERLGDLEDLQKTVTYQNQAIELASDNSENKPAWLNNLGNTYQRRFQRLGDLEDLQRAIAHKTQAVSLTSDEHVNKPIFLSNLGSSFKSRFERLSDLDDIHQAIDYQTQAVDLTPDDNEDKPIWLNSLGISYQRRFERLGQVEDIEKAIACQFKAVSLTPEGYVDKPLWMSNLGILYQHRYQFLGNDEDLICAIDYQSRALSLCPDDHYKRPSMHLNLGNSLYRRFVRFGKVLDIDRAVEYLNLAVSALPRGHSDGPMWLTNLGGFYIARFGFFGEDTDIDKATNCLVKALALTPDDHPGKPQILAHLAWSYKLRGNPGLIDVAIDCLTRAISLTPDGHEKKPGYIQLLGNSYLTRYKQLQDAKDLGETIRYQTMAVTLVPDTSLYRAISVGNLGQVYHEQFDYSGDLEDLNKAIEHYNAAISNTPDDHADSSEFRYHLGRAHETRFVKCSTGEDLVTAISFYQQGSNSATGRPSIIFSAARKWAELASSQKLPCAHTAYQRAMELLPHFLGFGRTIGQRYNDIKTIGNFALNAAEYAISSQSYDLALEWLEQGRSIVWNQILQLRTSFDVLSTVDVGLANELRAIGHSLEHIGSRSTNTISLYGEMLDLKGDAQQHRELALEWGRLLTKVRAIPGFEDFIRPKRKRELMNASKDGPVVVINVGETQGDALILLPNSDETAHIPLKGISRSKARLLRSQFYPLLRDCGLISRGTRGVKRLDYNPRAMFEKVLATLWIDVVDPILTFLDFKDPLPTEELPHITWCTTGDLSGFPLHAAGLCEGSQVNAFDLVVSSYTPTITALLTSFPDFSNNFSGILAVGQDNTPGFSPIPNTTVELNFIKRRSEASSSPYLELRGASATIDAVLEGMENYDWVHFACHASQNSNNPTDSSFHLYNGSLKLSTITQKSFNNKGLAFLSACQTATGAEDLPDEAVHLAAGLLMAGYPSVIATLWSVHDEDAPKVSQHVYSYLIAGNQPDHGKAARALHGAVQTLRMEVGYKRFERWMCFVHFGV